MSYNIDRIFSHMTGGPNNDRLGFFSYILDLMAFIAYT